MNTVKGLLKKVTALLIVISIIMAQFAIVGEVLVSYAIDMVKTNNENIEVLAYFENSQGEKVTEIQSEIDETLTLKIDVTVKNEKGYGGYFDGEIELQDANFKLKDESKIEMHISAGETKTIEKEVIYADNQNMNETYLGKESLVLLKGKYVNSKKEYNIEGTAKVIVNWVSNQDAESEMKMEVLTNHAYNEEQNKILQVLVEEKVKDNSYPVKNVQIEIDKPEGVKEVKVHKRELNATNGNKELTYTVNEQEGKLVINIDNTENIVWSKKGTDTIVVTYELEDETNIEEIKGVTKTTLYDGKELTAEAKAEISEDKDGSATSSIIEKEEEIYKGKIYTGEEREYTTATNVNIDYVEAIEKIEIEEKEAVYVTKQNEEKDANIEYVSSKVNKSNIEKIFGQEGFINIEDQNGNIVANINKDTETDENGNVIIHYLEGVTEIKVTTSKPEATGILNIVNSKKIKESLSKEEVENLAGIKEKVTVNGKEEETTIELRETETVATLNLENNTISTISEEEQTIRMIAKLDTSDESKELYKNAKVRITLPEEIKGITIKQAKALYRNGLEIKSANVNKNSEGKQEIEIAFEGEQTAYDKNGGLQIYLEFTVKTDKLTPSKTSIIKMVYVNENKNVEKEVEAEVNFESQYGLMVYNEISNYNQAEETKNAIDGDITARLDVNENERQASLKTIIINNYSEELENVAVNTEIEKQDVEAKTIETLKPGEITEITTNIDIPENLEYNEQLNVTQKVNYTFMNKELTKSANIILKTEEKLIEKELKQEEPVETKTDSGITANIVAVSAGEQLENESNIFEGQTIKYKVTISNNSGKDYSNVKLKAVQTNSKVFDYVEEEIFNATEGETLKEHYYKVAENTEKDLGTIESLPNGESYSFEYEVIANELNGQEELKTFGTITLSSADGLNESVKTIENTIKKAILKVTIEDGETRENTWYEKNKTAALIKVTNLNEQDINNAIVKIAFSSNLSLNGIDNFSLNQYADRVTLKGIEKNSDGETIVTLNISTIAKGETVEFYAKATMNEIEEKNSDDMSIVAKAIIDSNTYTSNEFTRTYYQSKKKIVASMDALTSNDEKITENTVVEDGEKVTFIATITNNDEKDVNVELADSLVDGLNFEKITIVENSEEEDITDKSVNNQVLLYDLKLGANDTKQVKLDVKINTDYLSDENVTNTFNISSKDNLNNYEYVSKFKANKVASSDFINPVVPNNEKATVRGTAWIDKNANGTRDIDEERVKDLKVRVINAETAKISEVNTKTLEDGTYSLTLEKGKYILAFMYDNEKYSLAMYQANGVSSDLNSDVITRTITIDGNSETVATTDEISLTSNLNNIDIGLVEKKNFDMKLEKFVEQIVVTNASGTKTYNQDNSQTLAKVEIPAKYLDGSNTVIVYKFRVTNVGDVEGYVSSIVDYLPKSLKFSSDLNPDWYQSGENIYNSSLSNTKILPGESKEIQLLVTKTMTNSNTELVENRAKIETSKNSLGIEDKTEDNAKAEVLIGITTGVTAVGIFATTLTLTVAICGITYLVYRRYFNKRIRI